MTRSIDEKTIIKVKVSELKMHPEAKNIYDYKKNKKTIKALGNTMVSKGQLEPIFINQDYEIISGNRRYLAALNHPDKFKYLNAIVIPNPKKIIDTIIIHNQQRKKSNAEIIKEAEAILGVLGKNQGVRNDILDKVSKDRFQIAADIIGNISASSLRRMMALVDFEKECEANKNLGLVDKVMNNELNVSRAFDLMKNYLKDKKERENALKVKERIIPFFTESRFEIINKSSDKMSEVPTNSIQVVITSPPYYQLRDYNNGEPTSPELGQEPTMQEYIKNLIEHLKDVKRVLKDEGSFFLNLGDTIRGAENLLIPSRVILNLCENEGWHVVNEIIWHKTNPLPASVKNRLHSSYEKIFHLVKNPSNYFYEPFKKWNETDEVKLITKPGGRSINGKNEKGLMITKLSTTFKDFLEDINVEENVITGTTAFSRQNELKKVDPDADHPALMPLYLPVIPILTTSKEGDTILDPFSGSGTVGKAALIFGRKYIGYELNKDSYNLSLADLNNTINEIS